MSCVAAVFAFQKKYETRDDFNGWLKFMFALVSVLYRGLLSKSKPKAKFQSTWCIKIADPNFLRMINKTLNRVY